MKDYLEKVIAEKEQRVSDLKAKVEASQDVNEVRNITAEVENLNKEISEARAELVKVNELAADNSDVLERAKVPHNATLVGAFKQPKTEKKGDVLDTMEYREAFANYVRTGKWVYSGVMPEKRDEIDKMLTTDDTSVIIPNTIMKEFIKEIKEYGSLFNEIRKTNVKGGVEYPIEDFKPEVRWITETETSKTQDKPKVNRKVSFNYHICEAKVGQSLLDAVVTLDTFEKNIANSLTEAFLAEFDRIILNGDGNGKPTGILVDNRILDNHKISMSEADIKDWKQWRRKLMSKVSLGYRAKGVFAMTANTWENYIMTMCDDNNRPLAKEAANVVNGNLECTFMGRKVYLVEDDVLSNFDDAQSSEAFAVYFNPKDYCINTNLRLALKKYFNDDTNKWTHKGLMIVDGKILDVNGCFIIKKSTSSSSTPTAPTTEDEGNG